MYPMSSTLGEIEFKYAMDNYAVLTLLPDCSRPADQVMNRKRHFRIKISELRKILDAVKKTERDGAVMDYAPEPPGLS